MVWVSDKPRLALICGVIPDAPLLVSIRTMPSNWGDLPMRSISAYDAVNPAIALSRSLNCKMSLHALTAGSRIPDRGGWVSVSAPATTCNMLEASCTFRWANWRPPAWLFRVWLIDIPAVTSVARLIRKAERSWAPARCVILSATPGPRWARSDTYLQFILGTAACELPPCCLNPSNTAAWR